MENFTNVAENSAMFQNGLQSHGKFHIPKFFQAILSLIISALLIALTLGIIKRIKKLCSAQCPIKVGNNGSHTPSAIIVVPLTQQNVQAHLNHNSPQTQNGSIPPCPCPSSQTQSQESQSYSKTPTPSPCPSGESAGSRSARRKSSNLNKIYPYPPNLLAVPLVNSKSIPRRPSGPFGEESLQFVQETYRTPKSAQRNPDLETKKSRHYHKSMRHYN